MVHTEELKELAQSAYYFVVRNVLAQLGRSDFDMIFDEYCSRRSQTPMAYIDVLPLMVYRAIGLDTKEAMPLAAAWILFLFSGRVLDDVLDEEGLDRPWRHHDVKGAIATGLFAIGCGNIALAQLADREAAVDIAEAFNKALALAASSETDINIRQSSTIEGYFQTAIAKTGIVFATVVWAAARLAIRNVADPRLQALYDFGLHMGVMVQIIDDCTDLAEDVAQAHWTLPVLHSLTQEHHPQYKALVGFLHQEDESEESVSAIAGIVEEMGSLAWSLSIATVYQEQAIAAITGIPGIDNSLLVNYVREEF
jgi:geranylgeranyl pyrophosphate synthase